MRSMVSILLEEMSYASHAARSSPTAVVKENGKETRLCVPTAEENEVTNSHLWNLLNLVTERFHRDSEK